jgi:hypothetical protein
MLAFQERNNRLTYSDEEGATATVDDKSFSLVEGEEPAEAGVAAGGNHAAIESAKVDSEGSLQPQLSNPKPGGLMSTVRNFFSR